MHRRESIYITSFASVSLPTVESIRDAPEGDRTRDIRKIQLYWAILFKAGFSPDEQRLRRLELTSPTARHFDPHFNKALREAAYAALNPPSEPPSYISRLSDLCRELEVVQAFRQANPKSPKLNSTGSSKEPLFDSDTAALIDFFAPQSGAGPAILRRYRHYHSSSAGDFVGEVVRLLDQGMTVILDLGNATDELRRYFADMLSAAVFTHQEEKFVENDLGDHFVQLYFEEAHNLFPRDAKELTDVYSRFAKEGAKFHIGIVYSTQSPSTISQELLAQTENFFVGHLSSQDEVRALERVQVAYEGVGDEIMRSKSPGYMRMLTFSHRFVVPMQADRFEANAATEPEAG
jgi:hypothetical protein